jgi:hypothetical protein
MPTKTTTSKRRPTAARASQVVAPMPARAWTEHDVAAFLRCSVREVRRLLGDDPTFPGFVEVGRNRLFDPEAVHGWLREQCAKRPRRALPRVHATGVADRV